MVTLGIIGIVAALTLPNLIANHREKETVVRLKKAYSTISQAYLMMLNDYGEPYNWSVPSLEENSWSDIIIMFSKYINDVKVCVDDTNKQRCFPKTVKDLHNLGSVATPNSVSLIMPDGVVIGIDHPAGANLSSIMNCNVARDLNYYCFSIIVDVNGNKGPNSWGHDTFAFQANPTRIVPRGGLGSHGACCDPTTKSAGASWPNGSGCGAWIIEQGNMDYLKCVKGNQKYCSQKYTFN